ncbi:unnamed protein product (macronuclear) [Paramecium tetraurelia]|uniref:EF-hand domain-containing protein n=1 Tax=Paramecium tetraurelia TaxID=5888 RepID=A0DLI3_PARTE|nr:uncharacterized protein GSPATT00018217001 [Paramecium tetraurelia]CAK83900.1 unnamed protein product [Paramecium tetraurelia]|eukprot:XP_001451297.1 hypothetical protein (macronuclear) [Paramecium tetraurelia strain d4-2]
MKQESINQTVYDRLYQDAHNKKLKKQLQLSENKSSSQIMKSQESEVNYGLILYQKGIQKKEEKLQKAESARKDLQKSQLVECTHKPQINSLSSKIAQRSPKPVGEHLNELAKIIQEKRENAQNYKLELEQQSCSFHPQINRVSSSIVDEKKKQSQIAIPHYESLYQDMDVKQQKLNELDRNYFTQKHTFHPKIDQISEQLVQGLSFEERRQKFRHKSKERNSSADESNMFRPRTGRPPEQRPENLFDNLYKDAQLLAQKRAAVLSCSKERMMNQSKVRASQKSEFLTQQAIINSLANIFDLIDTDDDGEIDAIRINLGNLNQTVIQILQPLFSEMEEGRHVLSKSEFIESAMRLVYTLSNKEKHDLLKKPNSKKSDVPTYTFQVQHFHQFLAINQLKTFKTFWIEKQMKVYSNLFVQDY